MEYDLEDPQIREMISSNHVPSESYDTYDTLAIRCEQCKAYWPCPAKVMLRKWNQDQVDHLQRLMPPRPHGLSAQEH